MKIPDCRKDKYYNFKNLHNADKDYIKGFDYCSEVTIDSFFANLDIYLNCDSYLQLVLDDEMPEIMHSEKCKTWGDYLKAALKDYCEANRDELITSIIDGYEDEL